MSKSKTEKCENGGWAEGQRRESGHGCFLEEEALNSDLNDKEESGI